MKTTNHKLNASLNAQKIIIASAKVIVSEKEVAAKLVAQGVTVIGSFIKFPDGSTQGSATISASNLDGGTYT